ncbi:MAG: hypothetical protein DRN49_06030, partial [Thaumarchaeota archaeon]
IKEETRSSSWFIRGQRRNLTAEVKLSYEKKKMEKLEVLGEIFINKLEIKVIGEDSLVDRFKWNLEVSLLRCLG